MNILISIILKILFSYLYVKFDVLCYYNVYQQKIEKGIKVNWFFDWLFKKQDVKIFGTIYKQSVPRYRVLHGGIMVVFWFLAFIFFYSSFAWYIFIIDAVIGIAWAYYFMTFERFYFTISDTVSELIRYQRENLDVYWLKRKWFYGDICFRISFLVHVFDESAFTGLIGMYLTSLIFLIQ
jgi:hypothetical protein